MQNCCPFDCIKYWIEFHRCLPASNKTAKFTSLTSALLKPSPRYRCKFRVIFHFKFQSINSSAFPSVPTSPGDKAPILFTHHHLSLSGFPWSIARDLPFCIALLLCLVVLSNYSSCQVDSDWEVTFFTIWRSNLLASNLLEFLPFWIGFCVFFYFQEKILLLFCQVNYKLSISKNSQRYH